MLLALMDAGGLIKGINQVPPRSLDAVWSFSCLCPPPSAGSWLPLGCCGPHALLAGGLGVLCESCYNQGFTSTLMEDFGGDPSNIFSRAISALGCVDWSSTCHFLLTPWHCQYCRTCLWVPCGQTSVILYFQSFVQGLAIGGTQLKKSPCHIYRFPWWLRWVKKPLAMQETTVWSLGWEDSPREGNGKPTPVFLSGEF